MPSAHESAWHHCAARGRGGFRHALPERDRLDPRSPPVDGAPPRAAPLGGRLQRARGLAVRSAGPRRRLAAPSRGSRPRAENRPAYPGHLFSSSYTAALARTSPWPGSPTRDCRPGRWSAGGEGKVRCSWSWHRRRAARGGCGPPCRAHAHPPSPQVAAGGFSRIRSGLGGLARWTSGWRSARCCRPTRRSTTLIPAQQGLWRRHRRIRPEPQGRIIGSVAGAEKRLQGDAKRQ